MKRFLAFFLASLQMLSADTLVASTGLSFTNDMLSGANMVLSGSGGASNSPYALLVSTNLVAPLGNWMAMTTNSLDAHGNFILTNSFNRSSAEEFYALKSLPEADDLWVPTCGAWLGNTYFNSPIVERYIGRPLDFYHFYIQTQTNLPATEVSLITNGSKLLINFIPATNWSWAVGVANGGKASVDTAMTNLARSMAKVKPAKVMVSILGEQERYVTGGGGNAIAAGTSAQFVQMWQNVWNIFHAVGATNVIWYWDVEGANLPNLYAGLWPGNNYVDWVTWDPYQDSSQAYTNKLMGIYNWFTTHSTAACAWTNKPWGLAEWGVGLNPNWVPTAADQATTFNEMSAALNNGMFPRLKLYAYFDESYSLLLTNAIPAYSNLCNSPFLEQQCLH